MNTSDIDTLGDLRLLPVGLMAEEDKALYAEAASSFFSIVLEEEVTPELAQEQARLTSNTNSNEYKQTIKKFLGWPIFDPPKQIDNEKFAYLGDTRSILIGRMPVFLLKIVHHPSRTEDLLVNETCSLIKKLKFKNAFLLFKKPITRKVNDFFYTFLGKVMVNEKWHNFYINRRDTPDNIVQQAQVGQTMIHDQHRADARLETCIAFSKLDSAVQIEPGFEDRILAANDTWYSFEIGSGLFL